ncbi:MAG: SDR family NAD(P)-dependent oxidoreductase, partial [Stackebrandtia sp.]
TDGSIWRRHLQEVVPTPSGTGPGIRIGGTYLITGGAGALGLRLAGHLAANRVNLVLVGRSDPDAALRTQLDELEAAGASVVYAQADVADDAAMRRVLAQARSRFGDLHGVVHAAGVIRDSFLRDKNPADSTEVLQAKIGGALVLDRLTRDDPLDFMVFFSSVVSSVGNVGQADYAYANGFLDELAATRESLRGAGQRRGKTVSIGWPAWSGTGMVAAGATADVPALDDAEGLAAFAEALAFDGPRLVLIKGDPRQVKAVLADLDMFGAGLASPGASLGGGESAPQGNHDPDLGPTARDMLRTVLADELRVPVARIDPAEPLEVYGIDSVMVMRLSRRLENEFGPLPKTLFFEYQNLNELSDYLVRRHPEVLRRRARPAEPARPPAAADRTPAADRT